MMRPFVWIYLRNILMTLLCVRHQNYSVLLFIAIGISYAPYITFRSVVEYIYGISWCHVIVCSPSGSRYSVLSPLRHQPLKHLMLSITQLDLKLRVFVPSSMILYTILPSSWMYLRNILMTLLCVRHQDRVIPFCYPSQFPLFMLCLSFPLCRFNTLK